MATWNNADGLLVRSFGDQGKRQGRVGSTQSNSKEQELILEVELTGAARTVYSADLNNDGTADGFSGLDGLLPINSIVTDQRVINLVAPAGGTNFIVGTYLANGTIVDDDGIRTSAGANGAQVGVQTTANWNVAVKTTGVYTAGRVKIIIRYVRV